MGPLTVVLIHSMQEPYKPHFLQVLLLLQFSCLFLDAFHEKAKKQTKNMPQ